MGKGKDPYQESRSHQSAPLSSLRDRKRLPAPAPTNSSRLLKAHQLHLSLHHLSTFTITVPAPRKALQAHRRILNIPAVWALLSLRM